MSYTKPGVTIQEAGAASRAQSAQNRKQLREQQADAKRKQVMASKQVMVPNQQRMDEYGIEDPLNNLPNYQEPDNPQQMLSQNPAKKTRAQPLKRLTNTQIEQMNEAQAKQRVICPQSLSFYSHYISMY